MVLLQNFGAKPLAVKLGRSIGAGTVEFEKILKELKQAHYDGTFTLEVFSKDREYVKISRDKVKRMWEEA